MSDLASYRELESGVLDAITAVHCLMVERNNLRRCLEAHDSEIATLRDTNEHLRRQIILFGDSYRNHAGSCGTSLQRVARAMRASGTR